MAKELDEAILQDYFDRIYSGDTEILSELYDISAPHIYRFALSIVKYQYLAEEVLQEVFICIMQNCRKHRVRKARSWLFTVVKNCSLTALKKEHFSENSELSQYENKLLAHDTTEDLCMPLSSLGALRELEDDELRLLLLCKLEGMTLPEAAGVLGLPRVKARSKYDYAVKKIKRYYRERGEL